MLPIATPLNALKPIATLATLALTRLDPGAITTRGLMVENLHKMSSLFSQLKGLTQGQLLGCLNFSLLVHLPSYYKKGYQKMFEGLLD